MEIQPQSRWRSYFGRQRAGFWPRLGFSCFPMGKLRFSVALKKDEDDKVETVNV